MLDDRPITPDQNYLNQTEEQRKFKQAQLDYLKKNKKELLPCQRKPSPPQASTAKPTTKTKAQVYEQIKKKN